MPFVTFLKTFFSIEIQNECTQNRSELKLVESIKSTVIFKYLNSQVEKCDWQTNDC